MLIYRGFLNSLKLKKSHKQVYETNKKVTKINSFIQG
jgi:hypothetical protein